jgi:hypothetical protein
MGALPAGTQYAAAAKGQGPADAAAAAANGQPGSGPAGGCPPLSHLSSAEAEYVCSDSPGLQGQAEGSAGPGDRAGSAADERPSKQMRV